MTGPEKGEKIVEPQNNSATSLAEVEDAKIATAVKSKSQGSLVLRRFLRHGPGVVSAVILLLIILLAITSIGVGPIPGWWQYNWKASGTVVNGGVPGPQHWFGQDDIGRDYFAVVMRGTQVSLIVAFVVGLVGTLLGTVIGAVAGYYRGWVDAILMRITDIFIVVPTLLIAAIVGVIAAKALNNPVGFAVLIGCVSWTGLARLVRAQVLSLREREYVDAARSMGAGSFRIIFKHLVPNAIGTILVNATLAIAGAILLETALSYLGFGIKAPETSLGLIISDYQNAFTTRPWLFWWPGLFILLIALSVNFMGDGLRDAFDPRQGGRVKRRNLLAAGLLGVKAVGVPSAAVRAQAGPPASPPDSRVGDGVVGRVEAVEEDQKKEEER